MSIIQEHLSSLWLGIALGIIFLLLNVLDAHSTWLVIKPDFYHRERNPIARWVFKKLGALRGIVVFKVVLVCFLLAVIVLGDIWDSLTHNIVFLVADIIFLAVVINNYLVWRRIRRRG